MKLHDFLRKRVISTLFLLFFTSCSQHCHQWKFQRAETQCPAYNSARIFLSPEDECNGLELEIVRSSGDLRMYVNIFSIPVPILEDNPKQAIVQITIGDNFFELYADRFEGGQRFLLPPEIYDQLLEALGMGIPVNIALWRYNSDISCKFFKEAWLKLKNVRISKS